MLQMRLFFAELAYQHVIDCTPLLDTRPSPRAGWTQRMFYLAF